MGRSACRSKSVQAPIAQRKVLSSIATAARRSRVRLCNRAARLTVSPITVQINRSADWMFPTKAGPVAIPTPTDSSGIPRAEPPSFGSAARARKRSEARRAP